ncbi:MAG: hypothetical protein WCX71_04870 [Candidatus Buchananbacteria bacterium]
MKAKIALNVTDALEALSTEFNFAIIPCLPDKSRNGLMAKLLVKGDDLVQQITTSKISDQSRATSSLAAFPTFNLNGWQTQAIMTGSNQWGVNLLQVLWPKVEILGQGQWHYDNVHRKFILGPYPYATWIMTNGCISLLRIQFNRRRSSVIESLPQATEKIGLAVSRGYINQEAADQLLEQIQEMLLTLKFK